MTHVTGIVLAAGAGTRMGRPKALVDTADGTPWPAVAVRTLLGGGCADVVVVLGASAREARGRVPADPRVRTVVASDWADGVAASLRTGLAAIGGADAVLVSLVDLPDLPVGAVTRLLADAHRSTLRQATYGGRPGHPVLIGADHADAVSEAVHGDRGAGRWLREHDAERVPCDDLWVGDDVDGESPGRGRLVRQRAPVTRRGR